MQSRGDQSTAHRIAADLEIAILKREFENGVRLDENELSARFGVSRTPVREALGRLALTGLVVQMPRRGTFVRQPGPAELLEMFEVMAELEASCGRLAARRADASQVEAIRKADTACGNALAAGDPNAYYAENETFHQAIYDASGNRFLVGKALRLQRRLMFFRQMQLHLRGRPEESRTEHAAIFVAIESGDGDRAAMLLRAHVAVQGERFHSLVVHLNRNEW
ncbi:GntR family transcriptional regulator [uncultured Jannaschia sp.]|uniref:GntR family transcriptional regulator n=1 Tax=uncultured Jannaschia sp. TaxID=293347 RepID=UPI00261CB19E|nr:GntR family transcriptional regulator [uncultured Jannaschia sp.]